MSTAIKFDNISKQYRLGEVGTGTLAHDLHRAWAKLRGKPDPFLQVGDVNDRTRKLTDGEQKGSPSGRSSYVWALRNISFEVRQSEVVGLIGQNGAGKSTLLKLLSRVTAPSTGAIRAKGRIASLLEVGTGFHPELSGRENIYLNGAILGMRREQISRQLDEIIEFSGCAKYIDTPVKRYSSGMTVRLGFAVAAHLDCDILVVDEVLAVGDAEFQKKCIGKMQEVSSQSGKTIIFVSHNMSSIAQLTSRCVWLKNGEVFKEGGTQHIVEEYLGAVEPVLPSVAIYPANDAQAMVIRKVQIENTGSSARFERSQPISIVVDYDLNRELSGVHVACKIYQHEFCVMTTSDADIVVERLFNRQVGRYRASVEIPGCLLSEGLYSVSVAAGIPFELNYDRATSAVGFEIHDSSSPIRKILHKPHSGVLTVNLPWVVSERKLV